MQHEPKIYRFYPIRLWKMVSPILILLALSFAFNWNQWENSSLFVKLCMGFFFFSLVLASIILPKIYFLELDKNGFTVHYIGGKRMYHWYEVDNFKVQSSSINFMHIGERIVFDLRSDSPRKSELIRASRAIRNFIPNQNQAYDTSFLSIFKEDSDEIIQDMYDFKLNAPIG